MVITALVLFSAIVVPKPENPPAWVTLALDSKGARKVVASLRRKDPPPSKAEAKPGSGAPRGGDFSARIEPSDAITAERNETSNGEAVRIGNLIARQQYKEAYDYLSDLLTRRPDLRTWMHFVRVECPLLAGRYDEAYAETLYVIQNDQLDNNLKYLWLSLACAARGESYPGQAEFCAQIARENYGGEDGDMVLHYRFENTQDPKKLMLYSAIAMGIRNRCGGAFYELALQLDPANEFAAKRLVEYYRSTGWYSRLKRVATGMRDRLPVGNSRDWFQRALETAGDKKDKPNNIVAETD